MKLEPLFTRLSTLLLAGSLTGCGLIPRYTSHPTGGQAFITYHPTPAEPGRVRLAVKDNIDVKGIVTTAGSKYLYRNGTPAKADAPCLAIARKQNAIIVGKANLSEFALSPSGYNTFFGTPRSPLSGWQSLIPGGSSCGSAVAVAKGLADVSFGTDTAGSVRVPAACSGVVGLKTTYGLIPIDGIYPIEPKHLDTVGPLGKDIAHTALGMSLLQEGFNAQYAAARAQHPTASSIRIGRLKLQGTDPRIDAAIDHALEKAGFKVVYLGDKFRARWEQAKEDGNTVAAAGAWISDRQYRYKPGISGRTKSAIIVGRLAYQNKYRQALARREGWQHALKETFEHVDYIALPTMQGTPPAIPINFRIGLLEAIVLKMQNTVAVNYAGNPALAVPVPMKEASIEKTSLQLIGPPHCEAGLLNAGRFVETAVQPPAPKTAAR